MKRILGFVLVLLLLGNFALPALAQSPDRFRFTRENFPTLDGSTSMVPLGQAIASVLLGERREDVADLIAFNRTTQSFRNLRNGQCDLVIAAEPAQQVFDEMAAEAFPYQMEIIAKEALIFVVNENNPVNSLTREQVRDIYAGKITNWNEVGGDDLPIEAFQRNSAAGSQVMMEKLVMDGTPMMDAPATRVPQAMGELIEAVRSFDGSANAIGYTVFYYAKDMQMAKGLKILKIDDVLPSADTIRLEEYPYINGYYACISALAPLDSPQRRLFDWLISEEGQSLLGMEGYVRVTVPGGAQTPGNDIQTDYISYAPASATAAQYTDFPCPKDHLEPSNAYGLIYPYFGARIYGGWGDSTLDYPVGSLCGFYNGQGQRITAPIFTAAFACSLDRWTGDRFVWVLSQDGIHYGFAAKDGSFVSPLCYESVYAMGDLILCSRGRGSFDLYDQDFQLVASQEDFRFGSQVFTPEEQVLGLYCGTLHQEGRESDTYALVDENGNLLMQSDMYLSLNSWGYVSRFEEDWKQTVFDPNLKPVLFGDSELVLNAFQFNDHFFSVQTLEGEQLVADGNGAIFDQGFDDLRNYSSGCFSIIRGDTQTIYDPMGRLCFQNVPRDWEYLEDGLFAEVHPVGLTLHQLSEGTTLTIPDGKSAYRCGKAVSVSCGTDDHWFYRLVDSSGLLLPETYELVSCITDPLNHQKVLLVSSANGFTGDNRILSDDGRTELFRGSGEVSVQGSQYVLISDWAFSAFDRSGKLLFCYPYYGLAMGD